jgi:hypothetical protein
MSLTTEQINHLRALKGAPLSILFALLLANSPIGRDQLVLVTGWGRDKVTEGLGVLQSLGLASPLMRYNGWELTAHARQFTLFEGEKIALDSTTASAALNNTTLSTMLVEAVVVEGEGDKIALDPEVLKALRAAGIGEPMASRLAVLPHVTLEYIQSHALLAKEEKINTGLLIHRIRSADPAPRLNKFGHLETCNCERCKSYRYAEANERFLHRHDSDEEEVND